MGVARKSCTPRDSPELLSKVRRDPQGLSKVRRDSAQRLMKVRAQYILSKGGSKAEPTSKTKNVTFSSFDSDSDVATRNSRSTFCETDTPRTKPYGPKRVLMPSTAVLSRTPPQRAGCFSSWCGEPSWRKTYSSGTTVIAKLKAFVYAFKYKPGYNEEMQRLLLVTYGLAQRSVGAELSIFTSSETDTPRTYGPKQVIMPSTAVLTRTPPQEASCFSSWCGQQ